VILVVHLVLALKEPDPYNRPRPDVQEPLKGVKGNTDE
jgi:hypothetical protein